MIYLAVWQGEGSAGLEKLVHRCHQDKGICLCIAGLLYIQSPMTTAEGAGDSGATQKKL